MVRTSEALSCFAQKVLNYLDVNIIAPTALGDLVGITCRQAGNVLRELGWEREHAADGNMYVWHRNGSNKDINVGAGTLMFRRWLRRNEQQ